MRTTTAASWWSETEIRAAVVASLEAGFRQDARGIELEERLSDQIAGLSSACLSTDEARALILFHFLGRR